MKYILLALGIFFLIKKKDDYEPNVIFDDLSNYPLKNKTSSKSISTLHPLIRKKVYELIKNIEQAGYNIIVSEGYRTFKTQNQYYNEGKTKAQAGQSYHNYGLAFDLYIIKDNKIIAPNETIVKYLKQNDFSWGGDWSDFKDYGHFEYNKIHYSKLFEKLKNRTIDNKGFVII